MLSKGITQACRMEVLENEKVVDSPIEAIEHWVRYSVKIARVLLPLLLFGYLIAGTLYVLLPTMVSSGNGAGSVVLAAFLGTLLMVPTAIEIPVSLALFGAGLPAMAMVSLVTLPPVSLPSLLVIGNSIGSYKTVMLLGGLVFLTGLTIGGLWLWLA